MPYLHTLFEKNVQLNPSAIAVKFKEKEISYSELNIKSNQLANYLIEKGVNPGDKVLICIDRSIEMIIAIFGILKCGGIYVPINSTTAKERFDFLLNDFDNPIILCDSKLTFEFNGCEKIFLDTDWDKIATENTSLPIVEIENDGGAIILYTSGSTGYPKGVLLSHKSLVSKLLWYSKEYNHSVNDIVLQHASYTFDFSILEIFMALANGGKLVLARPDFHYESSYILELIQKETITKIGIVPSLLKALINFPTFEKCQSLKQVFIGGESVDYNLTKNFFSKSSAELINLYGPTETSIYVLSWKCISKNKNKIIPIGYPVANTRIYLVNDSNEMVEDGEIGEIYIAGLDVAQYYKRPELNEKHFFSDKFTAIQGERMFKTGDYGKKLSNGAIQFCGRKDNQFKIRGLRVELGEIEHQLNLNENIEQSIVHIIETEKSEKKLVAYIIPKSAYELDIDEVKQTLQKNLLGYMIPSFFVKMDKFLLTPNGKINRKELPYPNVHNCFRNSKYEAPKNDLQKKLVAIWNKVLKIDMISINDSFSNLGGDSLALLEVHYYIEEEIGSKFPISELAKSNTIIELSDAIERNENQNTNKKTSFIQVQREGKGKTPIIFISPVYGEASLLAINLMKKTHEDHAFLATLNFKTDSNGFPESVEESAKIYVEELESLYPSSEYIFGGYSMGGLVALEMISILKAKGKVVNGLFLVDTSHPTILEIINNASTPKKIKFYLNTFIKSNPKIKKNLVIIVTNYLLKKIKSSFKDKTLPSDINEVQKNILVKSISNMDRLLSISLKYIPKKFDGKTILFSANNEIDLVSEFIKDNNITIWENNISSKLLNYDILTTHRLIMTNPYVEQVANIINEELLK